MHLHRTKVLPLASREAGFAAFFASGFRMSGLQTDSPVSDGDEWAFVSGRKIPFLARGP